MVAGAWPAGFQDTPPAGVRATGETPDGGAGVARRPDCARPPDDRAGAAAGYPMGAPSTAASCPNTVDAGPSLVAEISLLAITTTEAPSPGW
jgi:hypothetical protein